MPVHGDWLQYVMINAVLLKPDTKVKILIDNPFLELSFINFALAFNYIVLSYNYLQL